jgi:gamma-glutamyltranspeptidase/glutathione hydrolase
LPVGNRVGGRTRHFLILATGAAALAASGCTTIDKTVHSVKKTVLGGPLDPGEHLKGFIGGVAADEPLAALAAREVLATGGNAADAAVTLGAMLTVSLPSRASLGGGGACIAYQPGASAPGQGVPEAILFTPRAPATNAGDRPAGVPMMARGLYLLSARYGTRPFGPLLTPAQQAADGGLPISRALARDLVQVQGPLLSDPGAAAIFAPGGQPLGEGGRLIQTDLAATLLQLSRAGVGDLYQGLLAQRFAEASAEAGGPVTLADLVRNTASLGNPIIVKAAAGDQIAFLPPPADGGLGAAAAYLSYAQAGQVTQAMSNLSIATVATWRGQTAGTDPLALLQSTRVSGNLPALPASTSFVVVDRKGGAVACALTMENLFGTGRIAQGTGILLGASPAVKPAALLTAAVAWNSARDAFRAAAASSGQNAASLAGAIAIGQAIVGDLPPNVPVPDPGRENAIGCTQYLPGGDQSCRFYSDTRNSGLAAGGN